MGAMTQASDSAADMGRLANNYMSVQSLQASLSRSEMNVVTIPKLVARIIAGDSWKEWIVPDTGQRVDRWKASSADFREFIKTPRPLGCGTAVEILERLLVGTDAWIPYCQVIGGSPGGTNNPTGSNQYNEVNTDIIRNDHDPDIIPLPQRDRSNDMPGGTSRIAIIRRLVKETTAGNIDPEILEMVKVGDLSPHAAAVKAGFKDKAITIPADAIKASRRLVNHFHGEDLVTLARELANHAGFVLAPKE